MGNTAKQCRLGLFQDSDFAGDLEDSKSTFGRTLCVFGSPTFAPISWMCKKQTSSLSHSSTESEIIYLDARLRLDGIPAHDLPHLIISILGNTTQNRTEDFAHESHDEEVVDLVEVVRLLDEYDKLLLFETRPFHSIYEYFFCHNQPGIRVFQSPLDNQRESALSIFPENPNLFAFRVWSLNLGPWSCFMSRQKTGFSVLSWFIDDDADKTTSFLLQSDRLVFGTHQRASDRW